jgi:hypothetical protein
LEKRGLVYRGIRRTRARMEEAFISLITRLDASQTLEKEK